MLKNSSLKQTSSWKTAQFGEMALFLAEPLSPRGQMGRGRLSVRDGYW